MITNACRKDTCVSLLDESPYRVAKLMSGLTICFYHVIFVINCVIKFSAFTGLCRSLDSNSTCVHNDVAMTCIKNFRTRSILNSFHKFYETACKICMVNLDVISNIKKNITNPTAWFGGRRTFAYGNLHDTDNRQYLQFNFSTCKIVKIANGTEAMERHKNTEDNSPMTNDSQTRNPGAKFVENKNREQDVKVQVSATVCASSSSLNIEPSKHATNVMPEADFETAADADFVSGSVPNTCTSLWKVSTAQIGGVMNCKPYCTKVVAGNANLLSQESCQSKIRPSERIQDFLVNIAKEPSSAGTTLETALRPRVLRKNVVTSRTKMCSFKRFRPHSFQNLSSDYTRRAISLSLKNNMPKLSQTCETTIGNGSRPCATQDQCLEILHDHTLFPMTESEILDIKSAIEFLVHRLVYKIGDLDSRFYVRKIVPNGSFYDGSKICLPDEFDYLAVMDQLSSKAVNVSRQRDHNPGFAHISLNSAMVASCEPWARLALKGSLYSVKQKGDLQSFRDQFRVLFHQLLRAELSNGCKRQTHHITGMLHVSGFNLSLHGPECILTATWYRKENMTSFPITIDVCPAIETDCVPAIISENDPLFPSAYQSILQNERFYLIPTDSRSCPFCFKLAFTDSDRCLVTNLNSAHIKCFRVLKLLFKEACKMSHCLQRVINSFTLKMAVLCHADQCFEPESTLTCLIEILKYIREKCNMKRPYLPNVHIRSRNLWKHLDAFQDEDRETFDAVVKLIDVLVEMLEELNQADDFHADRFLRYFSTVVKQQKYTMYVTCVKKRCI